MRFDLETGEVAPVPAEKFLEPRRIDDRKADLWTTFNRIQENAIKGGLRGKAVDAQGHRRNRRIRK